MCKEAVQKSIGTKAITAVSTLCEYSIEAQNAMGIRHAIKRSKEPPPYQYNHHHPNPRKRSILLQQQLPINFNSRPLILPTILLQAIRHLPHPLQTIPSIQQILNILRHNLRHIPQLIIQLIQILTRAAILVCFFSPLHEGVKFDKGVGAAGGGEVLGGGVGGCEFGGYV